MAERLKSRPILHRDFEGFLAGGLRGAIFTGVCLAGGEYRTGLATACGRSSSLGSSRSSSTSGAGGGAGDEADSSALTSWVTTFCPRDGRTTTFLILRRCLDMPDLRFCHSPI